MEHIITKEEMDSLKALSDVNIKISEAQNLLEKLRQQETEYLVIREKKALERIEKTLKDSQELVRIADENVHLITELGVKLDDFLGKLLKIQENFSSLVTEFEQKNELWEQDIGRQQDEIAEITKQLKVQKVNLENDQKSLDIARKKLSEDQRKLDSDRGTIERTIKRLKENRI